MVWRGVFLLISVATAALAAGFWIKPAGLLAVVGSLLGFVSAWIALRFCGGKALPLLPVAVLSVITFPDFAEPYARWYFILTFGVGTLIAYYLFSRKAEVTT